MTNASLKPLFYTFHLFALISFGRWFTTAGSFIKDATMPECMVIFGDELSDTKNMFEFTNHTFPSSSSYYEGRMSNGLIWVDFMRGRLRENDAIRNYAFVGASCVDEFSLYYSMNLWDQVAMYATDELGVDTDCMHTFFFGHNDALFFIFAKLAYPDIEPHVLQDAFFDAALNVTDNVFDAIGSLYIEFGVKNFLLVTPFNLAMIPYLQYLNEMIGDDAVFDMMQWFQEELGALYHEYADYYNNLYKDLNIRVFSQTAAVFDWMYFSSELNFLRRDETCLKPVENDGTKDNEEKSAVAICDDAASHIFYDFVSPTSQAHELLSDTLIDFLNGECTTCKNHGALNDLCIFCADQ
mmetsp:Transcript_3361/g.4347  ORF Transcript_3361/g.4347 Transcript_3361/m.4347 type:complete len:353 (+) Transcript_3361:353-1411(+)